MKTKIVATSKPVFFANGSVSVFVLTPKRNIFIFWSVSSVFSAGHRKVLSIKVTLVKKLASDSYAYE